MKFISNCLLVYIIAAPLFMTTIGKVPLHNTLSFIGKSNQELLENTYYEGDVFKVFYKANEILPKGTILKTEFNEISLYNNRHFLLLLSNSNTKHTHTIKEGCTVEEKTIYNFNDVSLCEVNITSL